MNKAKSFYRLFSRAILGADYYEKIQFRRHTGYWGNFDKARTFNEKICKRKMSRNMLDAILLQDKVAVREFVKARVGDAYLTQCYQVLNNVEELSYETLPSSFVVKGNDGCGRDSLLLVDEKENIKEVELKGEISRILERHRDPFKRFYWYSNEWWYGMIQPKVIIEEHLMPGTGHVPLDYKFFVFHGKVEYVQVDFGRFISHTRSLYNTKWERQNFRLGYPAGPDAEKPTCLEEMIEISEKIASGYDFLRVDLYEIDNKRVVFGEITVAPSLGHARFDPVAWDLAFGDLW
ncbi:ATP-grasp fold amidoligase family protein [Billgrantia lactosivorans]|uniref:ATP-grasp fold amidoligase family protein n=1 Tax=Billgrantia lactosivorans TaxID=2185141 RepID=UPI0013A69586|nr:ATP-grasp fold amidoligase family protein [Halomonas lactosivorans]